MLQADPVSGDVNNNIQVCSDFVDTEKMPMSVDPYLCLSSHTAYLHFPTTFNKLLQCFTEFLTHLLLFERTCICRFSSLKHFFVYMYQYSKIHFELCFRVKNTNV